MKKLMSMVLATTFTLGGVALGAGCQTSDEIVTEPTTINVRLYKAGFGDAFIYELKQKFEEVYKDQNYKMNVLTPTYDSAGTPMIQEMSKGYEQSQVDLYITGAVFPNQVGPFGEYSNGNALCEDLEELVAIVLSTTESAALPSV